MDKKHSVRKHLDELYEYAVNVSIGRWHSFYAPFFEWIHFWNGLSAHRYQ